MGDQTKAQDDSALRLAERERAAVAHVRVVLGHSTGQVFEVKPTGTSIGRELGDLRLEDSRISRQHVRIQRTGAGWQVTDLGSRNGGFIDGRVLQTGESAPLGDGMVIRIGDTLLIFRACAPIDDERTTAPAFPGVSPVAAHVRRQIDTLAAESGHVLILGETGTGKERVARAMHRGGPFIAQNCSQLSRELARSELFGHLKGAFSGATQNKQGLVDAAENGVLFLDELGELGPDVQADLLRFLEDGSYRPVGEAEVTKTSHARVVTATNIDLDRAIREGEFRDDLKGRLYASNAPLELPPLRERREDIPQWIRLFLREAGQPAEGEVCTAGALECLLLYPWRRNLRELRGVVRALVAERVPRPWRTEDLPAQIREHRNLLRNPPRAAARPDLSPILQPAAPAELGDSVPQADGTTISVASLLRVLLRSPGDGSPADDVAPGRPPDPARREPTQAEIEEALRQSHGKMSGVAKLLKIQRRKLYRLCDQFGIKYAHYRGAPELEDK